MIMSESQPAARVSAPLDLLRTLYVAFLNGDALDPDEEAIIRALVERQVQSDAGEPGRSQQPAIRAQQIEPARDRREVAAVV